MLGVQIQPYKSYGPNMIYLISLTITIRIFRAAHVTKFQHLRVGYYKRNPILSVLRLNFGCVQKWNESISLGENCIIKEQNLANNTFQALQDSFDFFLNKESPQAHEILQG